jgi:hypothetical protein
VLWQDAATLSSWASVKCEQPRSWTVSAVPPMTVSQPGRVAWASMQLPSWVSQNAWVVPQVP